MLSGVTINLLKPVMLSGVTINLLKPVMLSGVTINLLKPVMSMDPDDKDLYHKQSTSAYSCCLT
jgi:hypothetical protein